MNEPLDIPVDVVVRHWGRKDQWIKASAMKLCWGSKRFAEISTGDTFRFPGTIRKISVRIRTSGGCFRLNYRSAERITDTEWMLA